MVNFNKLLIILAFLSLSITITTKAEEKKLSIPLMTEEELIYNQCIYTRSGGPAHIAKKNNEYLWDTMSTCKTYTKIPSNENLSKPKNSQKEIPISLMTDKELIYNQCKYTRDGTPTHIAKKNNAYDWSSNSTCKTYTKIPSDKNLAKQKSPKKLSISEMTDEELIYNQCIYTRNGTPAHIVKKTKAYNQDWDTVFTCKTYTKIPNNKNLAKPKSPQKKLSIPLMTDEELIYNQCIYTRDGSPTHEAKKVNQWMWDTMSKCKTYTKIPSKSNNVVVVEENDAEKDVLKQKKIAAEGKKKLADKKIEEEKKRIAKIEEEKRIAKIEEEKKRIAKIEEEKKIAEAQEEIENQKLIKSKSSKRKINKKDTNSGNLLKAFATNEIEANNNKKKIIRYECQQPWDVTTEDYRPLLDVYELDLKDRVLKGTHRYITDKEYVEERIYPVLAMDKDRVLVRYDSPKGDFSTKFFFNYATDQSIVATDNSYRTTSKCVNRDYFVDIKIAKNDTTKKNISKNDQKILELEKKEAILAQKEIEKIEKEQKQLLAKQNDILKNQKQSAKVAKLKVYEDPKKLNISLASSISKSQLKKYNATSAISYLFFESSENYLISLELLYRAYDLNTEADKIKSHLGYIKDSKSSEKKRLSSTQQIVKAQSLIIMNNIKDESLILSEQGKVYYAQSLPYALNAAIATYNLYHATTNAIKNVGKSGDVVVGILSDLNNIMGIAQIIPELPAYSKNMYQTTKLIISSAKVKKIKDSTNVNKALDELNLET